MLHDWPDPSCGWYDRVMQRDHDHKPSSSPWLATAAIALAGLGLACGCGGPDDSSYYWGKVDAGGSGVKPKDGGTGGGGSGDAGVCIPLNCEDLYADCGEAPDGCGGVLSCGDCSNGETCGAAGPNRCGSGSCTAKTCEDLGAECGLAADGCGNTLDCGECGEGQLCEPSGGANKCSGTTPSCAGSEADCDGDPSNGCEVDLAVDPSNCGVCGKVCGSSNPCNQGGGCESGSCVSGNAVVCNSPPDDACFDSPGTCNPSTGECEYSPVPNGTACGDPCHQCSSGNCVPLGEGDSYDGVSSHRCCDGAAVDITNNESHCGGCGLPCASGETCESVATSTGCSPHPASTSGRCTCDAGVDCPIGRNGQHQTCRNVTPYAWLCAPVSAEVCAPGQHFVDVEDCPNYCYYP